MDNVAYCAKFIAQAEDYMKNGAAKLGQIDGDYVRVNGNLYPYRAVTDAYTPDGSFVFVEKGRGNTRLVVGM